MLSSEGRQDLHSGELEGWMKLRQQSQRMGTKSHTCRVSVQTQQFEISLGQTHFLILEGIQRRQKVTGTPYRVINAGDSQFWK